MLSAVIITKNEEKNIKVCLSSLTFADEIVVVDSESGDNTRDLARPLVHKVMVRQFDNFAAQKNFAVSQASGDWILSVDADERVPDALAAEIRIRTAQSEGPTAYRIRRRTNLFGREFSFSGLQHDAPVRLFRKDAAKFSNPVHEVVEVRGRTAELNHFLEHRSFQSVGEHWRRLQLYTTIEAEQGTVSHEVRMRDPLLRPLLRFWSIYVWQQGFRDGLEGFIYATLSAYYEFVRWVKKWELS